MQSHHALRTLRLWVLAWFVMALGVAVASPLVSPRGMELVCTGSGSVQLVVKAADGMATTTSGASLDCPLCLAADAPPPILHVAATAAATPPFEPRFHARLFAPGGAALRPPARAPPLFN
ncbi:DUF2946 family protein [Acidovorax sp.]|uniref:DUF2946 family protein n=1 Tax=Acidovorax sp. TaxID=1872122 RepID=UPI0026338927|nr:DUF2946 family protein [Acidovorax sp.]